MQLEKVIAYHKALADPTRIRLLILLAEGELNGLTLAERLSLTPATITHHAAKLREADLINERREKNTIYFSLNEPFLRDGASAAAELIFRRNGQTGEDKQDMNAEQRELENRQNAEAEHKYRSSVLRNFFDKEGRLKSIPAQHKKKLVVLEHLAEKLEPGRHYPEKEINAFLQQFHPDYATLRREFIMHQYLFREKEVYERNPVEMWPRWSQLS
ncbi:metalloregulator ArsR/SmtB family transcription factor [Paenibacillus pasadenensis]|uniref:metalloregulator ArsR/SmtB family transcription factor n=1 Tax=Paenibacillus pasadenensis TaxID=217090 RepID=UPI00203ADFFA|nr:metalloregulator ArsR/SmtB family transcription factor [Paenibacillus pasadenensis]MCM3749209.1 metalloregulator ArsR/SmtB family transcription factor [Paenibacillus pasadenensis]